MAVQRSCGYCAGDAVDDCYDWADGRSRKLGIRRAAGSTILTSTCTIGSDEVDTDDLL